MFLCEVGMNNTLVGLLHPQADEKMFNFSKCSTPAPFLSLSFSPPWLFVSVAVVVFVSCCCCSFFSLSLSPPLTHQDWRSGVDLLSLMFTVGSERALSITNKRQHLHLQTRNE